MKPEKRLRWYRATMTSMAVLVMTGLVLGAYEIERRGWAFFVFRNTGAGAGNPAGLAEARGPRISAGARERLDMHAIQIAAFLIATWFAYYSGKWAQGWRPHRKHSKRPVRSKQREQQAWPEPVTAPIAAAAPQDLAPWEEASFYREPVLAVVTDAQPSRHWWRKRNTGDEVMDEAATFVSELHDTRGDEDTFGGGSPGTTTINSIEDVLAWGKRQASEMDTWAAEQKERMNSWTAEIAAWRDEPQLALSGGARDGQGTVAAGRGDRGGGESV